MVLVMTQVAFEGSAPDVEAIVAKMTEITGLQVVASKHDVGIPNLYHQHVSLAFVCLPEERLELSSYIPGAAKKYYESFMPEFSHMATARFAVGLHESPGMQVVYLRSFIVDYTLMSVAVVALEALGGRPDEPISDDERREAHTRLTEAELLARRRKTERKLWWSAVLYILLLPITIPLMFLSIFVSLALMPWRLWKARGIYQQYATRIDHNEFLDSIPNRMTFLEADPEGVAKLDVPIGKQKPTLLDITLEPPHRPGFRVAISVNGHRLFDDEPKIKAGPWSAQFPLQGVELGKNARIEINGSTFVPAQGNQASTDGRTLGVRVKRLVLVTDPAKAAH